MKNKNVIQTGLAIVAIVAAVLGIGYGMATVSKSSPSQPAMTEARAEVLMVPANFSELAEKARSGVVNIQVVKKAQNVGFAFPGFQDSPFGEDGPLGRFFQGRMPMEPKQEGVGSGFVISAEGYVLTNNHVIEDAEQIKVKLANGDEYVGKIVGRDPKTDLALLQISGASNLHALPLGNSEDLRVGSWVVAIGSPFGLEQTVTQGIVSGKGRVIGSGPYDDFIQTDASINPGNSGGPLINMKGEVIGINTAINPSGQGIGFAIPIDMAKSIIPQLEQKGSVTRGWLGVSIQPITPALEKSFGLKNKDGALVADVFNNGPAERSGIERGDIIIQFDGKSVSDSRDLSRMVAATPVGKTVAVKLMRDGKEIERPVKVGEMEKSVETAQIPSHKSLGLTVQQVTPQIVREMGLRHDAAVVVTHVEVGSAAADAGIQAGDVIREVNRRAIKDVEDFNQMIGQAKNQGNVLLLVQRGERNLFAAVTPR